MTLQPETITTYTELCARIRELQARHKLLVYRGQIALHSARLVPTAMRLSKVFEEYTEYDIDQLQDRWLHGLVPALRRR